MLRIPVMFASFVAASASVSAWAQAPGRPAPESIFEPLDWPSHDPNRLASGAPGPAYWQQRADYRIAVTLDTEARALSGRLACVYTNNSPHELRYLWLNLDQNAFRPDSIGARALPPDMWWRVPSDFVGGFELSEASVDGAPVEVQVYDSMGKVPLPGPLAPGASVTLELSFSMNIPPRGRLGVYEGKAGEVFQLAHWFPNVAVYDDTHGWNVYPHQGDGEFYTNFGRYELEITVPSDHIVAATGVLANAEEVLTDAQRARLAEAQQSTEPVIVRGFDEIPDERASDQRTWRFVADDVRTVAWASSRAFRWDAAIADTDRPVLCQAFYPPEGLGTDEQPGWERAVEYGRHAINYYSEWLMEYPYPTATNIGGVVGGMEYPMIVFCSLGRSPQSLFGVTDHEFGHMWYPMIVNTDERRHAWMDEGFNTFINHSSYSDYWGEGRRISDAEFIVERRRNGPVQPIVTIPDQVHSGDLGYLAYAKPGYAMRVLREVVLGEDRFDDAFREYTRRWAFKSPRPEDFFRTMEDAAGADLSWFWRGWFYESASLDQAVAAVQPTAQRGRLTVTLANLDRMVMPADVLITYADGSEEERRLPVEAWARAASFPMSWDAEGREIVRVEVDPRHRLPDMDRRNNVWEAPAPAAAETDGVGDADESRVMPTKKR
ncbi:MAG: M1 family metallopeptidase [Phycisphaerales bacterium]